MTEIKMYAVAVSVDEAWEWMTQKPEELEKVCEEANVKAVHPDPLGRFQAFLYLHPKARNKAYQILRKYFKTAFVIANPAFVPIDDMAKSNQK